MGKLEAGDDDEPTFRREELRLEKPYEGRLDEYGRVRYRLKRVQELVRRQREA